MLACTQPVHAPLPLGICPCSGTARLHPPGSGREVGWEPLGSRCTSHAGAAALGRVGSNTSAMERNWEETSPSTHPGCWQPLCHVPAWAGIYRDRCTVCRQGRKPYKWLSAVGMGEAGRVCSEHLLSCRADAVLFSHQLHNRPAVGSTQAPTKPLTAPLCLGKPHGRTRDGHWDPRLERRRGAPHPHSQSRERHRTGVLREMPGWQH